MIRFKLLTAAEKEQLKIDKMMAWHKWFAWKPVRLSYDHHEIRWLGFIYRKGIQRWNDGERYFEWQYVENEFDLLKHGKEL